MEELLELYSRLYQCEFIDRLGEGKDGEVFLTDRGTAVKFHGEAEFFHRESRAYRALANVHHGQIAGFACPTMVNADDTLWAIEMSVVRPPFVVDFVSAYTDEEMERLAFDEEVQAEREAFWIERFGDRWPQVQEIRAEFHKLTGLMLLDLSLNNIRFE